jgi:hypothetical protein
MAADFRMVVISLRFVFLWRTEGFRLPIRFIGLCRNMLELLRRGGGETHFTGTEIEAANLHDE